MLSKTSSQYATALRDYLLAKHRVDRLETAYRNHENLWVQECADLAELADWLRDEDYSPWVDFWDVTALGRMVFECWDNPPCQGAREILALCNTRSGKESISKDSPFYPWWKRFIEGRQSLLNWLCEEKGADFHPAELLFHAKALLDKHWRRTEKRCQRYSGDPRLLLETPWFSTKQHQSSLTLPKKSSRSQTPNKAFAKDFLPLMLAARLVMHFFPQSGLLQGLALQSQYHPKTNEEYELYFSRLLLKHQVSRHGASFIKRHLVALSGEELLYLCDVAKLADDELKQIVTLFDAMHDPDLLWDEYLDK
ncbi:hypothetical protein N5C36_18830 [Shewanella xiamenensis]|uniref:hypothetical protein n=1 Tax=Shewanella xiamenensis TaxID=332186 RepID=UPI00244C3D12|nr:hypothetical protein [Shewanella xiamenensis]MDH1316132.1 hypothetical protein [Shewanella xiamenensis]